MPDSYTHLWLQSSDAVCGLSGYLASSWSLWCLCCLSLPWPYRSDDSNCYCSPPSSEELLAPHRLVQKGFFVVALAGHMSASLLPWWPSWHSAGVLSPGWLKKSSNHFVHSTPLCAMPKVRPGIFGACGSAGQGWPSQWAGEVHHNACVILCIYGSGSLDATLEDMFDGLVPCSFVGSDTGMYSFNADFRLLLAQHAPAATVSAVSFLPVPLRWRSVFAGRRAWRIRIWNAQRAQDGFVAFWSNNATPPVFEMVLLAPLCLLHTIFSHPTSNRTQMMISISLRLKLISTLKTQGAKSVHGLL